MELVLRFKHPYLFEIPILILLIIVLSTCRALTLDKAAAVLKSKALQRGFKCLKLLWNWLVLHMKCFEIKSQPIGDRTKLNNKSKSKKGKKKKSRKTSECGDSDSSRQSRPHKQLQKHTQRNRLFLEDDAYFNLTDYSSESSDSEIDDDPSTHLQFADPKKPTNNEIVLNPYWNITSERSVPTTSQNCNTCYSDNGVYLSVCVKETPRFTNLAQLRPRDQAYSISRHPQESVYVSRRLDTFPSNTFAADFGNYVSNIRDLRSRFFTP